MGRRALGDDGRDEAVRCTPTPLHSTALHYPVLTYSCVPHRPLKAQLQAELSAAGSEDAREEIQAAFAAREKALEHDLDHKPMDVHLTIDMSYNFLSK